MAKRSSYKQTANVEAASTTTVFEIEKPTKFTAGTHKESPLPKPASWGVWMFITGAVILGALALFLASAGLWYWRTLESTVGASLTPLVKTMWTRRQENIFTGKPVRSILLLGLDQSKHLRENSILTDTIMLVTVNENGTVAAFSIPRDLWIDSLKTKINALYYYGQQNNPEDALLLLKNVITEITGVPVDNYMMVTMDTVKETIDALGGVSVTVERSFVDKLYPREIDLTSTDPNVLYETVAFTQGDQKFDGTTALKYIRSRFSEDPVEGTDAGREIRQQRVMTALMNRAGSISYLTNPKVAGSLYNVWKQELKTDLDEVTLFLMAKELRGKNVSVSQYIMPVSDNEVVGLIYHPKQERGMQWVYMPVDPTWQQLHKWVAERI